MDNVLIRHRQKCNSSVNTIKCNAVTVVTQWDMYMYYVPNVTDKIKTIVLLILILFLGCSNPSDTIKVGQGFSVVLETDWKSQTHWVLLDYDKTMVKFLSSTEQGELDPHMMDQPAQNTFYFTALKPGETDLDFQLQKIWNTGNYGSITKHILIR
jgi:hypothetical protein